MFATRLLLLHVRLRGAYRLPHSLESQRYKQKVRGKGGSDKSSFIKDRRHKKASIEQSLSGR